MSWHRWKIKVQGGKEKMYMGQSSFSLMKGSNVEGKVCW